MCIFFRMAVIPIYSDGWIDIVCSYEASLECTQNPWDRSYVKKSVLFGTSSTVNYQWWSYQWSRGTRRVGLSVSTDPFVSIEELENNWMRKSQARNHPTGFWRCYWVSALRHWHWFVLNYFWKRSKENVMCLKSSSLKNLFHQHWFLCTYVSV